MNFDPNNIEYIEFLRGRERLRKKREYFTNIQNSITSVKSLLEDVGRVYDYPIDVELVSTFDVYDEASGMDVYVIHNRSEDKWHAEQWPLFVKAQKAKDKRGEKKKLKQTEETAKIFKLNEIRNSMISEYGPEMKI